MGKKRNKKEWSEISYKEQKQLKELLVNKMESKKMKKIEQEPE